MSYLSGQSRVRPAAVIIAALIAVQSLGAAVSHPFRTPASSSATKTATPGPTARPKPDAANHATNNQTSLGFIRNSGLAAPAVRYFAQAAGAGFYFEASRAVFTFTKPRALSGTPASAESRMQSSSIALRFVGANPLAQVEARSRAAGVVNYLVGKDPSGWQRNLPTWQEVVYRDLWPGIDMVFHGRSGELKDQFLVRPGADPSRIQLAYEGAQDVSLDAQGALQLRTALGTMKDAAPVTWQETEAGREPVDSRFVKNAGGAFGFALGSYDRAAPLTIDPGLLYSTMFGGVDADSVADMVRGADGSFYLAGSTSGPGFLTGAQPYDLGDHSIRGMGVAVLVAKIAANGRDLVYATVLSASGYSEQGATGIAVDAAGAAYVTGLLNSSFNNAECGCFTDFPTTPGAYQRDIPPHYEPGDEGALIVGPQLFALKLDPTGTAL